MKELVLQPTIADTEVLVQFTESIVVDRGLCVSVPNHYVAVVVDNERISFRIEPCSRRNIAKDIDKGLLGHTIKIAFILNKAIPEMMWGFGNIQVNNERLKEAYRIGANGRYAIEIADYSKLINSFSWEQNITIDSIKEKTISIIKTVGIPILSEKFANSDVSVFEINALVDKMREALFSKLCEERAFKQMGIKLSVLTLNGIYVNEDDLEMIRKRING